MFTTLSTLSPETVFLLQGDAQTFQTITSEAVGQIVAVESQVLSRFTMEHAEAIVSFNLEREGEAWHIVYFDIFMSDAAQVLLKTLEEPRPGKHIVFITPHPYLIPQTIRSRVRLIQNTVALHTPQYLSSKKAVTEYIKEVFGDEKRDASVRRAEATVFLDALEHHVRADSEKLTKVYEAKEMLFNANMPTKQVIEYIVALVL